MRINNDQLFKSSSTTFFGSSRFFPEEIRHDVSTLYAFVRTADNYVDSIPQDKEGFYNFIKMYRKSIAGQNGKNQIIDKFVLLEKKCALILTGQRTFC